jgi:hypothetical protein
VWRTTGIKRKAGSATESDAVDTSTAGSSLASVPKLDESVDLVGSSQSTKRPRFDESNIDVPKTNAISQKTLGQQSDGRPIVTLTPSIPTDPSVTGRHHDHDQEGKVILKVSSTNKLQDTLHHAENEHENPNRTARSSSVAADMSGKNEEKRPNTVDFVALAS